MTQSHSYRNVPTDRDVQSVGVLVEETGFFRPDEVDVAAELVQERLQKGEESGYYFCFADDPEGNLLGYVCYGPTPCTVGSFDLYWIVVGKGAQGRGLGAELDARTVEACRTMGGRKLYVETSGKELYQPTRAFYRKTGYREAAILKDFYDIGDDKVILEKDL
jgi:Sortase and related acyltransferases